MYKNCHLNDSLNPNDETIFQFPTNNDGNNPQKITRNSSDENVRQSATNDDSHNGYDKVDKL